MSNVYRVGSLYKTEYFNAAKEANRCRPGGEEPESVECVDAAAECNRLERSTEKIEQFGNSARLLLEELRDICPDDVINETEIGRRVSRFLEENPMPPATSADRDGQRSYGTG